jgi:hypothetical protein
MKRIVLAVLRLWNTLRALDERTALRPIPVPVRK